jgi:uncharacterized membrane protein
MFDLPNFILKNIVLAWGRNVAKIKYLVVVSLIAMFAGIAYVIYVSTQGWPREYSWGGWLVFGVGLFVLHFIAVQQQIQTNEVETQDLRAAKAKAQENPDRPEFAWDLARAKLERYLDRNLYEVRAIFFLTTLVMLGGFGLVVYGLLEAFAQPATFNVSIVSAASGVLLSFIGGSFMLIYRSVLTQSANYVAILERINAVGMAVQIASTVPENVSNLRAETTAALARALLVMYETKPLQTTGAG